MELNIEQLKRYLECNNEFLAKIINGFIIESKKIIQKLEKAGKQGDRNTIRDAAHKILSSTRLLNLDELTALFENIETGAENNNDIAALQTQIHEAKELLYSAIEHMKALETRLQ